MFIVWINDIYIYSVQIDDCIFKFSEARIVTEWFLHHSRFTILSIIYICHKSNSSYPVQEFAHRHMAHTFPGPAQSHKYIISQGPKQPQ